MYYNLLSSLYHITRYLFSHYCTKQLQCKIFIDFLYININITGTLCTQTSYKIQFSFLFSNTELKKKLSQYTPCFFLTLAWFIVTLKSIITKTWHICIHR